jgi:hypothetical protein
MNDPTRAAQALAILEVLESLPVGVCITAMKTADGDWGAWLATRNGTHVGTSLIDTLGQLTQTLVMEQP